MKLDISLGRCLSCVCHGSMIVNCSQRLEEPMITRVIYSKIQGKRVTFEYYLDVGPDHLVHILKFTRYA